MILPRPKARPNDEPGTALASGRQTSSTDWPANGRKAIPQVAPPYRLADGARIVAMSPPLSASQPSNQAPPEAKVSTARLFSGPIIPELPHAPRWDTEVKANGLHQSAD